MASNQAKSGVNQGALGVAAINAAAEKVFDDLAWLAAQICRAPIALVSVVTGDQGQKLKAKVGLSARDAAREFSFCEDVLERRGLLTIEDALQHELLADHALVINAPGVRFLAGVPLMASDGVGVGTLLVMDRVPRQLSAEQGYALEVLARQLVNQLELRQAADKSRG